MITVRTLPQPRTWRVLLNGQGDAPTIQAGIDSSETGDTVLVGPGIYFENIDFLGKGIHVRSELGPTKTIINGRNHAAPVVSFKSRETRQSIIEGFAITGGTGYSPFVGCDLGGGIFVWTSEPTIQGNEIINNGLAANPSASTVWGGGIMCWDPDIAAVYRPLIIGNWIANNSSLVNAGGIGANGNIAPEILSNVIEGNLARHGDGGGVWILTVAMGSTVHNNIINSNSAGDHGGGIYIGSLGRFPLEAVISRNIVWNNSALGGEFLTGDSGGGLWLHRTNAIVRHNTIVSNLGAGLDGPWGGGILLRDIGAPFLEYNIIAFNREGGGIVCRESVNPRIQRNILWMNAGGDTAGCPPWVHLDENYLLDPLLCNPEKGDFRIDASSLAATVYPVLPGAAVNTGCGESKPTLSILFR